MRGGNHVCTYCSISFKTVVLHKECNYQDQTLSKDDLCVAEQSQQVIFNCLLKGPRRRIHPTEYPSLTFRIPSVY